MSARDRFSVYFDLETGGIEMERPIIQLAAIAYDARWQECLTFNERIKFDVARCDPRALELNHYTPEAWADAVDERTCCQHFVEFLKTFRCVRMQSKTGGFYHVARLVGHNAASFDGPRLSAMFKRHAIFLPADPRVRDTQQLAMWWFDALGTAPKDFKLATLCEHFSIPTEGAHDAFADVRMTARLARAMKAAA